MCARGERRLRHARPLHVYHLKKGRVNIIVTLPKAGWTCIIQVHPALIRTPVLKGNSTTAQGSGTHHMCNWGTGDVGDWGGVDI